MVRILVYRLYYIDKVLICIINIFGVYVLFFFVFVYIYFIKLVRNCFYVKMYYNILKYRLNEKNNKFVIYIKLYVLYIYVYILYFKYL